MCIKWPFLWLFIVDNMCLHGLALTYTWRTTVSRRLSLPAVAYKSAFCQHSTAIAIPRTNTGYGDRSFAVSGPSVWNSLPTALRMSDCSLTTFRTQLKALLFIWYIV